MIIFDLRCANNHGFEGWFDSGEDFDCQLEQGQIACPYCEDIHIEKVPSPVAIKRTSATEREKENAQQAWQNFCRYINDNFEDVGHDFANEAIRVHHGIVEERNIRGVTSKLEEDMLKEEGVPFVKIPMPQQLDS